MDAGGFIAAKAEAVITQANFHRPAQRREAENFDFLVFEQAHLHHALQDGVVALQAVDASPLAFLKLVEGHRRLFAD